MRQIMIAASALALGLGFAGAASAQASGPVGPGQRATGMDIPQATTNFYVNAARQEMTDNLRRKQLAVKAADLINHGHCKEAYMVANEAMDTAMMRKIIEICRAPAQAAAAPAGVPAAAPGTAPPQ